MTENKEIPFGERRRDNGLVQKIVVGVSAPLIIAVLMGYVGFYSTVTRLDILIEQMNKRIVAAEKDLRQHKTDYHHLQITLARQGQSLEALLREIKEIKEDQRRHSRQPQVQ